jgi:hypothetical protein
MPAGYTEIKYNNIVLRDCMTKEFRQEPVWDRDGQTLLYHKFTVTVQGYFISGSHTQTIGTPPNTAVIDVPSSTVEIESTPRSDETTSGGRYKWLSGDITARRKKFVMTVGVGGPAPQIILLAEPAVGGVAAPGQGTGEGVSDAVIDDDSQLSDVYDRNGGPRVRNLKIDEIIANETFRVNVTFEVCLRPRGEYLTGGRLADIQRGYGVISNRWACVDTIDQHRFTTRVYQGQITLSSPFKNPHEFRFLALPPIEPGMQRKNISFVGQEDGLKLRYVIRDEEVVATPIGMGTEVQDSVYMHVSQEESIAPFGTHVITNFTITLQGTRVSDRKELARMAAVYADAKMALYTFVVDLKPEEVAKANERVVFIEAYQFSEEFDSAKVNKVRLHIRLRRNKQDEPDNEFGMLKQVFKNFGNDVDGPQLANATPDPVLKDLMKDYDRLRSWGNRKFPSTDALENEIPFMEGTTAVSAALACHLQSPATYDYSLCTGMLPNADRIVQVRDSRFCDVNATVRGTIRNYSPALGDSAYSTEHNTNVYEHFRVDSEYRENDLVAPLPVAAPADPHTWGSGGTGDPNGPPEEQNPAPSRVINETTTQTKFIQLAPPQCIRIVKIEATRWGAMPRLPPPKTSFKDKDQVGHSLMKKHVNVGAPRLTGNGDMRVFTVHAEYVYAMSHTPKQYLTGIPDYESNSIDGVGQFVIPIADLFSSDKGVDYVVS